MLSVALVDDDESELLAGRRLISRWRDGDTEVRCYDRASSLLSAMDDGVSFELYLLDVVMPEMDGIRLGHAIRERDSDGSIVYMTTSPDFALESYDVWPLQYLIKPVEPSRLYEVLEHVSSRHLKRNEGILVHTRTGDRFLLYSDILYAERSGRRIRYA